jgi:hypothetical protein
VRIVSRADGTIGQVLGYHYRWTWAVRLVGTEEQIGAVEELYTVNNLGQRLTESGSVTIQDVRVGWASAAGFTNMVFEPLVYNSLNVPLIQQIFSNLYLGIAQGALEKAASNTSTTTRAWPYGGDNKDRATEEFYILAGYGDLQPKLWADEALINRVDAQISEILHAERSSLTEQARGELAVRVAAAKVRIVEDGLETATRVFEPTGARASSNEVGEYVLLNTLPEPSRYT